MRFISLERRQRVEAHCCSSACIHSASMNNVVWIFFLIVIVSRLHLNSLTEQKNTSTLFDFWKQNGPHCKLSVFFIFFFFTKLQISKNIWTLCRCKCVLRIRAAIISKYVNAFGLYIGYYYNVVSKIAYTNRIQQAYAVVSGTSVFNFYRHDSNKYYIFLHAW